MRYVVICALLSVAVLVFTACPKPAEKTAEVAAENAIERAAGGNANVDIQQGGDKVKIETDKGTMEVSTNGSAALPEGWPETLPVYPGAQIKFGQRMGGGAQQMLHVELTTSASGADVLRFYDEKAKAAGFASVVQMNNAQGGTHSFETPTQTFNVTATSEKGSTTVILMLSSKQAPDAK